MSDDILSSGDELNLDDAIDTDGENAESNNPDSESQEQNQDADFSFLEDQEDQNDVTDYKEAQRRKTLEGQINAAKRKLNDGDVTLEDLPSYLQEALEESGFKPKSKKKAGKELDEEAIVTRALERMQEQQSFESLKSEIKQVGLTKDQAGALKSEYKELLNSGMAKSKALSIAARLAGLGSDIQEARNSAYQMGKMNLSPQGQVQTMRKAKGPDPSQMSDDDFLNWSNKQANGADQSLYTINH